MIDQIEWNCPYTDLNTSVSNDLQELVGETIRKVTGGEKGDDECIITTLSGKAIKLYHKQNCCESVYVADADSDKVEGGLVISAGFVSNAPKRTKYGDEQWSFLTIHTTKGTIWQRWVGESNGYYSTSVDVLGGVVQGSES